MLAVWIRSTLFNTAYVVWTVICVSSTALFIPFKPSFAQFPQVAWSCGVDWLLRRVVGAKVEFSGLENIPEGPCIIASKHESAWDTSVFQRHLYLPAYVIKRELSHIPFFGYYCKRYGMIAVDRRAGGQAIRGMIRSAQQVVAQGRPIVIFPEGTRVAPNRPAPYHPGVYALYSLLKLPVIPVALNSGVVWARRTYLRRPGRIRVEFLPAIEVGMPKASFMNHLENLIEERSRILREGSKPPGGAGKDPGTPSRGNEGSVT